MSDQSKEWWDAHCGIVGLAPGPWNAENSVIGWPTDGYDSTLYAYAWEQPTPIGRSGHTREEWLLLADVMIERWQAWRAHVESLPEALDA